jgi:hypothetical protein
MPLKVHGQDSAENQFHAVEIESSGNIYACGTVNSEFAQFDNYTVMNVDFSTEPATFYKATGVVKIGRAHV